MTQLKRWYVDSSFLPLLQTGTVGDLIDHNSRLWKVDLIRSLYHHPKAVNILQMPISKTNAFKDRLMWKHSMLLFHAKPIKDH